MKSKPEVTTRLAVLQRHLARWEASAADTENTLKIREVYERLVHDAKQRIDEIQGVLNE